MVKKSKRVSKKQFKKWLADKKKNIKNRKNNKKTKVKKDWWSKAKQKIKKVKTKVKPGVQELVKDIKSNKYLKNVKTFDFKNIPKNVVNKGKQTIINYGSNVIKSPYNIGYKRVLKPIVRTAINNPLTRIGTGALTSPLALTAAGVFIPKNLNVDEQTILNQMNAQYSPGSDADDIFLNSAGVLTDSDHEVVNYGAGEFTINAITANKKQQQSIEKLIALQKWDYDGGNTPNNQAYYESINYQSGAPDPIFNLNGSLVNGQAVNDNDYHEGYFPWGIEIPMTHTGTGTGIIQPQTYVQYNKTFGTNYPNGEAFINDLTNQLTNLQNPEYNYTSSGYGDIYSNVVQQRVDKIKTDNYIQPGFDEKERVVSTDPDAVGSGEDVYFSGEDKGTFYRDTIHNIKDTIGDKAKALYKHFIR